MTVFDTQFQEIKQSLHFEDYNLVIKRIIDLTLDTKDLSFYTKTSNLLLWVDYNQSNLEGKREKYSHILDELYHFLSKKTEKKYDLLLETKELKKAYSQSAFALGPVNLSMLAGEIIGLIGENGNGKTTLLRSLCQELNPTSGSITYHFDYKDTYDLRSRLIYIPQRTDNWYGSMLDNLKFTASSYGIHSEENNLMVDLVLTRMGLREYRNLSWKSLSSGYKMRFELARMLLRKPKLLLIDEPLANLDILAQQTVLDDFKAIAKSPFNPLGIILSSQQLYEVEKTSDQIIFLKHGVQKNLNQNSKEEAAPHLVIEFESEHSQKDLYEIFHCLNVDKIQLNGGTFIASFPNNVSIHDFLQVIIQKNIYLKYFRDISNSTRRFFI